MTTVCRGTPGAAHAAAALAGGAAASPSSYTTVSAFSSPSSSLASSVADVAADVPATADAAVAIMAMQENGRAWRRNDRYPLEECCCQ